MVLDLSHDRQQGDEGSIDKEARKIIYNSCNSYNIWNIDNDFIVSDYRIDTDEFF